MCTTITKWKIHHYKIHTTIKLRKEMGNVSKRQQPDHRADNSMHFILFYIKSYINTKYYYCV